MPSKEKSEHLITTKDALEREFENNGWEARLSSCRKEYKDQDYEFATSSRSYRRQQLVKHYDDDSLVAFTIEYTMHDGSKVLQLKMLLINGIRHIVP